jgi:hypothetical protein
MSETDPSSGGLVSSLLDAVSREVGSFITNATGGVVTVVRLLFENCIPILTTVLLYLNSRNSLKHALSRAKDLQLYRDLLQSLQPALLKTETANRKVPP